MSYKIDVPAGKTYVVSVISTVLLRTDKFVAFNYLYQRIYEDEVQRSWTLYQSMIAQNYLSGSTAIVYATTITQSTNFSVRVNHYYDRNNDQALIGQMIVQWWEV